MARYLDPKNDLIFKRIFGTHPHLLVSFLNALMPLSPDRQIERIEYLSPEQVPDSPLGKDSIVDVKCIDNYGRQFIVEMQMYWNDFFNARLVFNAAKAYVRQLGRSKPYSFLQPVYGLGIINAVFDYKTDEFYHHYQTLNRYNTDEVIEGLEFVLVELPKFRPQRWADRRMAVLWLRFLKEVEDSTQEVSADLLANEDIREALMLCEEGAFSLKEMEIYDHYWDYVRKEKGLFDSARQEGRKVGRAEGKAEGRAEGKTEGLAEGKAEGKAEGLTEGEAIGLEKAVIAAAQNNFNIEQIRQFSGLSEERIREILKRKLHGGDCRRQ